MQKIHLYIVLFISAAALGAVAPEVSLHAPTPPDTSSTPLSRINLSENEVIDFRNSSSFSTDQIEKRPVNCPNHYRPWNSFSKLDCAYTENKTDEVTIAADYANYVDSPLGTRDYHSKAYYTSSTPWDLEFLPNGTQILSYRRGEVEIFRDGKWGEIDNLDVITKYETGLLGLAVDPNFQENQLIYLYYTYKKADKNGKHSYGKFPVKNRISRFKLEDNLTNEEILIDEIPGNQYHSGGRLEFGPDGKLYATTGEAGAAASEKFGKPQSPDFLGGKVLRLNTDGSVPEDNPFNNSYIYSSGHRNPQGLAWNPENGDLYTTEHGQWREDEINHIIPGKNYGWPEMACGEKEAGNFSEKVKTPVQCYKNWTMAPSGATFVHNRSSPWYRDLFVAGLRGKHVTRLTIENDTVLSEKVFYFSTSIKISQRLRDVEYFNGSIWIIGDSKGMTKLTPITNKRKNKSSSIYAARRYPNPN